ncbi:MAG: hypothetical protein JJE10_00815 [Thermoleophilia bacterium]|nr:hypothetical protein [Thermoleophilia bacterium]
MKTSLGAKLIVVPVVILGASLFAAGCGSDDKPEFCSDVSALQDSVDELTNIQLESGVLTKLESDLQTVETNAKAVDSSAKQDFPSETSALDSSVSKLANSIQKLPESPSTQQLVALAPQISAVGDAWNEFSDATESACD